MVGSDGVLSQVESQTIEVGDVVRLEEDDVVPADLVVLSTSHEHGQGGNSMGFQWCNSSQLCSFSQLALAHIEFTMTS